MRDDHAVTVRSTLRAVVATLRRRPTLCGPFFVAGVVTAVVGAVRTTRTAAFGSRVAPPSGFTGVFAYPVPMPVSVVGSLPVMWVEWPWRSVVATGGLTLLVATAGVWATVVVVRRTVSEGGGRRPDDRPSLSLTQPVRLLVYHSVVTAFFAVITLVEIDRRVEIPLTLSFLYLVGRTFLVPAGVVAGRGLRASVRWSWRQSCGHTVTFLVVAAVLGIGGQFLVKGPAVLFPNLTVLLTGGAGTVLATTVAGTTHAVAVGRVGGRLKAGDQTG